MARPIDGVYAADILAPTNTDDRWRRRVTTFVLVGGVAFWVVNALVRWSLAAPLGHDEARYALDAQDLLSSGPRRFMYSAPGMSLVPIPGLLAGASERALRVLPILLGLGFLASAWHFARTLRGDVTAAWTVAALAGSPQMAVHSSELLSDLPSVACLLLAITILVEELSRPEGLRRRIILVAPLCAAAFYLRYGSCVPIAIVGGAFVAVGHRAMLRRPWPVVWMVVLFAALLAPDVLRSLQTTGSVTGILKLSAEIPGKAHGIGAYLREPLSMYGLLIAPLMVIGLFAFRRDRFVVALQLVAVAHIVVLASTTQAQPRFVYFATVILVSLGADATARFLREGSRTLRIQVTGLALTLLLVTWGYAMFNGLFRYRDARTEKYPRTFISAEIIKSRRSAGRPCEVLAGDDRTRLEWYSGCRALIDSHADDVELFQIRDGVDAAPPDAGNRIAFLPGLLDVTRIR